MESCKGKTVYEIIDTMEDTERKLLLKYLKEMEDVNLGSRVISRS